MIPLISESCTWYAYHINTYSMYWTCKIEHFQVVKINNCQTITSTLTIQTTYYKLYQEFIIVFGYTHHYYLICSAIVDNHFSISFTCPQPGCCVEPWVCIGQGKSPILQGPAYSILCHKQEGYLELGKKNPVSGLGRQCYYPPKWHMHLPLSLPQYSCKTYRWVIKS